MSLNMNAGQTPSPMNRQTTAVKPTQSAAVAVSMLQPVKKEKAAPTREEIAKRAYELWLSSGREPGQDQKHWLEAERQLRQR